MDMSIYAVEAQVEETHWWFVVRRELFMRELAQLKLSKSVAILDLGTSTGTNLRMLRDARFNDIAGLDFSEESVRFCAEKGLPRVYRGDICDLPFKDASYDVVLATDIIEHVDDDHRALGEVLRVLKPGGHVLITVPAFMTMWSQHDVNAHHKRRYRLRELRTRVARAGLQIDRSYYFNFILFGPIWLARRVIAIAGIKFNSDAEFNSPSLNWFLKGLFRLDTSLAPLLHPPFGVSALVLAHKPTSPDTK
jgi:SAM-dependent methyltransferase